MKINLKADVQAREIFRKLTKLKVEVLERGYKTVNKTTDLGKQYARSIAPYNSGRTANFIIKRLKKLPEGTVGTIQAQNPTRGGSHRLLGLGRYGGNFNLVRWMHETGGVFQSPNPLQGNRPVHIKSGDPQFMYTTARYLQGRKVDIARKEFKNINIRGI